MYVAILGRQPALSLAELERVYGSVTPFSETAAFVDGERFDVQALGGTQKAGRVVLELPGGDWRRASMKLVQHYAKAWAGYEGKLTLGISAYGFDVSRREVQKTGLVLKAKLKDTTASLRLIPNQEAVLSTATSHHNKLGLAENKIELLVVKGEGGIAIAESVGAQNITALAARDQGRPKRDAFVGMLPPKLALLMVNLSGLKSGLILDPFCGTGVVLQEALLRGFDVYGSDLSEKMTRYTDANLKWLIDSHHLKGVGYGLALGDATSMSWEAPRKGPLGIDAVVSEAYLGQPFSAPPSAAKLAEVRGNCNHIISGFLKNLAKQVKAGTPVVLAVPAWKDTAGNFTHLPLIGRLEELGYRRVTLGSAQPEELLYYRPDQVVARELLILEKV